MPSKPPVLKGDISKNATINRLLSLLDKAEALEPTVRSLALTLNVIKELAACTGLHSHTVTSDERITVNFLPVPDKGAVPIVPLEPKDPAQLPLPFGPSNPVTYDLRELLHEDEDQEQSPPGFDPDSLPKDDTNV